MVWIPFTEKSAGIDYKHSRRGIGNGEEKVAAELNTTILGQNSPYDMDAFINGTKERCEVKELDSGTFNSGANGRDAIRDIQNKIFHFLTICRHISASPLLTPEQQEQMKGLVHISPDEVSEGSLLKISMISKILCDLRKNIISTVPSTPIVSPFEMQGKPLEMDLPTYFTLCKTLHLDLLPEYQAYAERLQFLEDTVHPYIQDPQLFSDSLNGLPSIFTGMKLIFVDKVNGYCICDTIESIKFCRITQGRPRFRLVV